MTEYKDNSIRFGRFIWGVIVGGVGGYFFLNEFHSTLPTFKFYLSLVGITILMGFINAITGILNEIPDLFTFWDR